MGLSVGVVTVNYLDEPRPPVSDFLKDLAMNPSIGLEGDHWCGGWGENTFLEFEKDVLSDRAENWCEERLISAAERAALLTWIFGLA